MYLIDALVLVGGLLLLVKGADLFVVSSSQIAKRFQYILDLKARIETDIRGQLEEKRTKRATKESCEETEENSGKEERTRSENKTYSEIKTEYETEIKNETENIPESSFLIDLIKLIASGATIIIGVKYFVEQSIFSHLFEVPEIFLIPGCSGLVHPITVTESTVYYITPFMLFISLLLLLFILTGWRIKRYKTVILFLIYSGFMIFIFRLG